MFDLPLPYGPLVRGVILTAGAMLWTILLVRIVGLRAFSKMTAFDFVTTIASSSLVATAGTRTEPSEYLQTLAAIAGIFLVKWLLSIVRLKSDAARKLVQNKPVLLMENGQFLDSAMSAARVSRASIIEKLRSANVARQEEVKAVVLETTGDISVMSKQDFDERLLEGVKRVRKTDLD